MAKINHEKLLADAEVKKAAIYIRVSTEHQIDKDSLSVQRRELIAYADMVLGIKDYYVFEDPGYSAKNTDRPDYQNMMARIRSGEFSHLLVWKLDRISRNLLDFAAMYAELKSLGVTFVSKNEQFDTSNAIGEAMLKIILVFAELERKMTAERVTAVMLSRANSGKWNGGHVPFGYTYDKETKTFSFNETERAIYLKIVEMYEQHQSLLYVARKLNEKGYPTKRGTEWSPTTVNIILRNIWYTGAYRYNLSDGGGRQKLRSEDEWITIEDHHEPMISQDRFEKIQAMLARNRRGGFAVGKTYERKNVHLFAGLVTCAVCGEHMSATIDRRRANGWRPSIYACKSRRENTSRCQSKYVSDVTLGPFVFNFIANIVRTNGRIGKRTSLDQLQKKLLKGEAFAEVSSINEDALEQLRELLLRGETGVEYRPPMASGEKAAVISELEILRERKRKYDSALGKLKSLYLFEGSGISETEYILERQKILLDVEATEKRITELQAAESGGISDPEDLVAKASYFIMAQKLLDDEYIDYGNYLGRISPEIPRAFIRAAIREIVVDNGRVASIEFRSGIKCIFSYGKTD